MDQFYGEPICFCAFFFKKLWECLELWAGKVIGSSALNELFCGVWKMLKEMQSTEVWLVKLQNEVSESFKDSIKASGVINLN